MLLSIFDHLSEQGWEIISNIVLTMLVFLGGYILSTYNENKKEYDKNRAMKFTILAWVQIIMDEVEDVQQYMRELQYRMLKEKYFTKNFMQLNFSISTDKIINIPDLEMSQLFSYHVKGNVFRNLREYSQFKKLIVDLHNYFYDLKVNSLNFQFMDTYTENLKGELQTVVNELDNDKDVKHSSHFGISEEEFKYRIKELYKGNEESEFLNYLKNESVNNRVSNAVDSTFNWFNIRINEHHKVYNKIGEVCDKLSFILSDLNKESDEIFKLKINGWGIFRWAENWSKESKDRFYIKRNSNFTEQQVQWNNDFKKHFEKTGKPDWYEFKRYVPVTDYKLTFNQ